MKFAILSTLAALTLLAFLLAVDLSGLIGFLLAVYLIVWLLKCPSN